MKRVFHHLAFYNRLCIAKPFYTTQLAGNTPFCCLKHQRLQKATLNCFLTWNKANNVVQKRINKNRLQHIFSSENTANEKNTLCLQTFDGKHAVAQPAKRQWRCEKQRKACANTTKHACPQKTKQAQSNCLPVHETATKRP